MVTLKEIAAECGVSTATVSNILNGKKNVGTQTREKVLEVVNKYGYKPNMIAKGLRKQKTNTIGIIAEDFTQFTVPPIIDGAMQACEEKGYKTVVQNLRLYSRWHGSWFDNDRMVNTVLKPAVEELSTIFVDGIIYVAGHGRKIVLPDTGRTPIVLAYSYPVDETTPYTVINDRQAAYEAVHYLTGKGHRKIGVVSGELDNMHTQLRLGGYQQALYEASILYNPGVIFPGAWNREGGYRAAGQLIPTGVTAIFAMNDRMAGGIYEYCEDHGIVIGKDISVIGFDGELLSEFVSPSLTTMEIPLIRFGQTAAAQLIGKIEEETGGLLGTPLSADDVTTDHGRGVLMRCSLVERKSVADIR